MLNWIKRMTQRLLNRSKPELARLVRRFRLGMHKKNSIEQTQVIAGSPRSGTTWLAAVLQALPRTALSYEPLHLNRVPEAREAGFSWRTYLPPDAERTKMETFLRKVLQGNFFRSELLKRTSVFRAMFFRRLIVKSVRANRLLPWLLHQFPDLPPPLLLLRHPCAVVSSQLQHPDWDTDEVRLHTLPPAFRDQQDFLDSLTTPEEKLAASWAIDQRVALEHCERKSVTLVTYEGLVRHGRRIVRRLLRARSLPLPEVVLEALRSETPGTLPDSAVDPKDAPLKIWRKRLSEEQVDRVLSTIRQLGIRFYGKELKPDYDQLSTFDQDLPFP